MVSYSKWILGALPPKKITDFSFAENTTYGVGGKATLAYLPTSVRQAYASFDECKKTNMSHIVLGKGSNVLASDSGFDGAVISTKHLRGIARISESKLYCLAGTPVSEILRYCHLKRLGGLEFLNGIPASVGGAAFMNAGVSEGRMSDCVCGVNIYDGKRRYLGNSSCNFGYRQSTMQDIDCVITSVILNVKQLPLREIECRRNYFLDKRRSLPKGRSCGCVFKNGKNYSAAELIDRAGLKGFTLGGAYVSEKHANFIICKGAEAFDVKRVIEAVKLSVKEKFGVTLCEEVVYIGDFNDTDC